MPRTRKTSASPFGLSIRGVVFGAVVIAAFFSATLWALDRFFPAGSDLEQNRPALTAIAPLPPVTRTSVIVAPVAIATLAIRDAMEANAPRELTGKNENPLADLVGKADIGWTISRGPFSVAGLSSGLNISSTLGGSLRITGQPANQGGNLTGKLNSLLGDKLGSEVEKLTTRALDQRAGIRGNVTVTARPALLPDWRVEPNLSGRVTLADGGVTVAGHKLNIASQVKPLLDKKVADEIGKLSSRLRNDRSVENAARKQWRQMCRSIPLGAAAAGAPSLWLEVRPTRAFAAQPQILADWLILTLGVQAETRIVASETTPDCPFPARLDLVAGLDQGKVTLGVPIDVPFSELSRLLELQLKDKTFPETGNAPGRVTVLATSLAAVGDRLLISLRVKATETRSWLGLGGEATVHVWGRPVLDRERQIIRLADISLDVRSEAAFGLLGAAARAAIPTLQKALADRAVVDLKPFAASALQNIDASIRQFQNPADGVEVEASVTALRLTGIEFDSTTLRVTAEADGSARALVRKLAVQ